MPTLRADRLFRSLLTDAASEATENPRLVEALVSEQARRGSDMALDQCGDEFVALVEEAAWGHFPAAWSALIEAREWLGVPELVVPRSLPWQP